MSGSKAEAGDKGGNKIVGTVGFGFGGNAYSGLGGRIDGGGGEDTHGTETYRQLIMWEDTVANITLGTNHNASLAYVPGLELHHQTISTLGAHGVQLEREREREIPSIQTSTFYLPHVQILGTNHCGELRRTAFKGRELFQDILCHYDYAERVVSIFSHEIKSE